jgi:tetratricopeptide (TPR) repeat protein
VSSAPPSHSAPIERLFLIGSPDVEDARWSDWLRSLLPTLNWRSQLFLVPIEGAAGWSLWHRVVQMVTEQLVEHRFVSLWLRPVLRLSEDLLVDQSWTDELLRPMQPFHDEAFSEQSESRLLVQPVLAALQEPFDRRGLALAEHFRARLATPTLLLRRDTDDALIADAVEAGMRVMLEAEASEGTSIGDSLLVHHVVDSALDTLEDGGDSLLEPCARHLVADLDRGAIYPCLRAWMRGYDPVPLSAGAGPGSVPAAECPGCITEAALAARSELEANRRRAEGRQLLYGLARELATMGDHSDAAGLADGALELADTARDRAAAAMMVGLCRLELGQLEASDAAFCRAGEYGADPGVVAYQRGRVQMAWPDEIEALERFEEALALPSLELSLADLHLEMAKAHIRLEEYAEAMPHLEPAETPANRTVIRFLAGVCDLNRGKAERALANFEQSLDHGPEPDDLARVLLYAATSLKELDRYDEAISLLERALEADPDELAIHNLLGFCLYKLGRHAEAVEVFRRAVEIDPSSAIDWANLGSNLRDLGRSEEAIEAYRRALSLDPSIGFASKALKRLEANAARTPSG